MKHLYWSVCGVISLGLIVTWVLIVPADEARAVKTSLDKSSLDLKDLEKRAKNPLNGVFDAENPADTKRLAKDFLITEKWQPVLQRNLDTYKTQFATLKQQLLGRGKWLAQPVRQTADQLEWYTEYTKVSEALLGRLMAARCLRGTAGSGATNAAAPSEGVAGSESPAELRNRVGLYTKGIAFPEPREHPLLTARLHVMEMISDRLIAARIAVAENPLVGQTGRSEDRNQSTVTLLQTIWEGGSSGDQISHPVQSLVSPLLGVNSINLRLELEGSLSAVLSAAAALEHNADPARPLIVVTASTLSRKTDFRAGDRFDAAGEPVRLELALSVLEFVEPAPKTKDN